MAEPRPLLNLSDDDLASALQGLAGSIAFSAPTVLSPDEQDIAARVRARIVAGDAGHAGGVGRTGRGRRFGLSLRPMRRGLILALAALLVLAAIAGAVGLGLPGLRIVFGDGPPSEPIMSPSASRSPLGALGSGIGLGTALPIDDVERLAGFDILLPSDPAIGPPEAAYLAGERVNLVWPSRPDLPETEAAGVGLLISEFRGRVHPGYYEKLLSDDATVTRTSVDGAPAYWIAGAHFFYYMNDSGDMIDDSQRIVGDTLIWASGDVTYRLESSLGMTAAIRLAESLE